MGKAEKLERAWRDGAVRDVAWADAKKVLEKYGFSLRRDRDNHWLAEHHLLRAHPYFSRSGASGRLKINCHFGRRTGIVHPMAIRDILSAIDFLKSEYELREDD